jgi:NDP-sugar pyrophosphorylase family protein
VTMAPDGRIVTFLERPTEKERALAAQDDGGPEPVWVNSGIQMLHRDIIPLIPSDRPADLPRDVVVPLHRDKAFFGFPLTGERIAIDSPERYREAEAAVARGVFARGPLDASA